MFRLRAAAAIACLAAFGCNDSAPAELERGCDPLVPSYCGFPYPNDYWTVDDPDTPTGKRLALTEEIMPEDFNGIRSDPGPFNAADGFSAGIAAMTHMPGATVQGLPSPETIAASLEEGSPTVILNAETGERLAHWAELDWYVVEGKELGRFDISRPTEELQEEQTLMLRPAVRPEDATRYIVAIRDVVDEAGAPLPPSPAFAALRDDTPSDDPEVEGRRGHFEDIFEVLEDAGIPRDDLQLAWDFTTASRENNTRWMVHMRDEALSNYPDGVPYEVEVRPDAADEAHTACVLDISFEMPLYTRSAGPGVQDGGPGSELNLGEDGLPEQNGTHPYSAAMVVPLSATDPENDPAPLVEYGHGQLGLKEEVVGGFQEFANQGNLAMFALDWKGFAFDDMLTVVQALNMGDLSDFRVVPERMHQGFLNFLIAMRTLSREAEGDTELNQVLQESCGGARIDGESRYYFGGSQGGILGASIMALSTDVERGVLAVPGQPYNILLNRSVNFDDFSTIVYPLYGWNGLHMQMNMALMQGLWDRAEPTGYSKYIRTDTLPNTPPHEVLMQVSVGDHQVTDLGAHIMARTIGAVNLGPAYRDVWGLDEVTGPHEGSAMLEIFFGNTETPIRNIPPWEDTMSDPHSGGRNVDAMVDIVGQFLRDGVAENLCDDVCDEDDISN
ncbi:MAG: hypothetical protein ACODAU_04305 [Myxococcota bacterium]